MKKLLAIIGAAIGVTLGFFGTGWLARQGLYSVLLPGALLGFGALLGKGHRSIVLPIVFGLLGVVAVYLTEWHYFPFVKDKSLFYFIGELATLKPLTHVMAALGGAISFWFPFRSR